MVPATKAIDPLTACSIIKTVKNCSNCGWKLVTTHSRRNLQELENSYYVDSEISRCVNKNCACHGIRLYPKEYSELIYPKSD